MPGSWGLAAIRKKCCRSSPTGGLEFFCDIGATNVKETRLGEPVLIGRAIKRGWGEPSNEVGASHQTRLVRAIKRGWGEPSNEVGRATQPQPPRLLQSCALAPRASSARARSAHLVPARHGACSAHLVPARHCTPSTVPARHRGDFPTSARSALGCLLGTCPLGTACASSARARSAHLVKCPLGTATYWCPLGTAPPRRSSGCPG